MRKWLVILALLFTPDPVTDEVAWVDPDGFLVIQVERGGELLYFDSFNIRELYGITLSPRMAWENRWEFRRE